MLSNKIKISNYATQRLRILKGRVGLTPNILARIGICLSLEDKTIPNVDEHDEEGQEFNRYTLTGEWDHFILALVKQRCMEDGFQKNQVDEQFRAHLNRGVLMLYNRVKSLTDMQALIPQEVLS